MDKALGDYEILGREIGRLVNEKQKAYGNSFGKAGEFLKLLFPDGIDPDKYTDALALVRIFDKQMRIATHKDALDENPYQDIAGYGMLGAMLDKIQSGPVICEHGQAPEIDAELEREADERAEQMGF